MALTSGRVIHEAIFDEMIAILRADTTLQERDANWDSEDVPHVIPGVQAVDPRLGGERNVERMPFCEIGLGLVNTSKSGTYYVIDLHFTIRTWLVHGTDTDTLARAKAMAGFQWDIWEAFNAYWLINGQEEVLEHYPANLAPRLVSGDAWSVGEMDYIVRAGMSLITPS